jgi:hypothetical protein
LGIDRGFVIAGNTQQKRWMWLRRWKIKTKRFLNFADALAAGVIQV